MPLKIAISGLTLARGLSHNPNLQITVYESAARYLDIGGGLAFHGNAIRALGLIDPALREEYFKRATRMSERDVEMSTRVLVGDRVDEKGEEILLAELGRAKGTKTIARSDLLEELVSLVPEGKVRFGRRIVGVEECKREDGREEIKLRFQDGTVEVVDVLIGCDGVHSVIGKYLLGEHHPAVGLKNHDGWKRVRRSVAAEEVNVLNERLLTYVPILCGNGAYMNCIPTHFGKILHVCVVQISKKSISSPGNDQGEAKEHLSGDGFKHWIKDARDSATLGLRDPVVIGN